VFVSFHSQLYIVYGHKLRVHVGLLPVSLFTWMFESVLCFVHRVYDLHVDNIKWIQISNVQYKFKVNLFEYHDVFNVRDYFMIQIRLKKCHLKTSKKL
jgi:uncharacterized membrane protein